MFLCLVFLMLSRLFIAALWSPAGKGLTSWLLSVMFIVFLLLSHVVSWLDCIVSWALPSFLLLQQQSTPWACIFSILYMF